MTGTIVFWVIVAILVIAILYAVGIYNALVGLRNQAFGRHFLRRRAA